MKSRKELTMVNNSYLIAGERSKKRAKNSHVHCKWRDLDLLRFIETKLKKKVGLQKLLLISGQNILTAKPFLIRVYILL